MIVIFLIRWCEFVKDQIKPTKEDLLQFTAVSES